jgi:hypothetical protein
MQRHKAEGRIQLQAIPTRRDKLQAKYKAWRQKSLKPKAQSKSVFARPTVHPGWLSAFGFKLAACSHLYFISTRLAPPLKLWRPRRVGGR